MPSPTSSTSAETTNRTVYREPCGAEGCDCHYYPDRYQLDYELNNKKVRQYTIADVGTVRVGLWEHIQAFLEYHKVPAYNGYEYARWCFGIIIIAAGTFSYLYKYEEFMDNRPVYMVSAAVFAVCTAAQLYISKFVEGADTIYITKPYPTGAAGTSSGKGKKDADSTTTTAPVVKALLSKMVTGAEQEAENDAEDERIAAEAAAKEAKKNKGKKTATPPAEEKKAEESVDDKKEGEDATAEQPTKPPRTLPPALPHDYSKYVCPVNSVFAGELQSLLANRHVRLRLETRNDAPVVTLHADLLDASKKTGFWSSPKVLCTATAIHAYGTFFDKEGFVHPPEIKAATMELLRQLDAIARKQSAKGETKKSK